MDEIKKKQTQSDAQAPQPSSIGQIQIIPENTVGVSKSTDNQMILPLLLSEKVAQFPSTPGVYLMRGEGGKIIYIGKAKNIRSRVRQYLSDQDTRYQIAFLMKRVVDIDYLVTDTEKEALLLENSLIKKHRPRYNIFLKDDKTYVSLKLTPHACPSLLVTRKVRKDGGYYFGPYSSATACRETVDFVYRHFQLRTCTDHEMSNRSRPCLEHQIGRCTAPCVGLVSVHEYGKQVEQVKMFLKGKSNELVGMLKNQMQLHSEKQEYEKAQKIYDLLKSVDETLEKQKVVTHGGWHQDIVVIFREGNKSLIALMSVREGVLIDSRYYPVDSVEEDPFLLHHFLAQYYLGHVFIPDDILVSVIPADLDPLLEILAEKKGKAVEILVPRKGRKHELIEMALKNASAQWSRHYTEQERQSEALKKLAERLGISSSLHRMECYDISNISGKYATASRVVFIDGKPDKKEYRHYKIRLTNEPNDYAMMREVLQRRFETLLATSEEKTDPMSKPIENTPDLLILDGGKGQLGVAQAVMKDLNIVGVAVIGVAKGRGPGARAKGEWKGKKEEEIFLPGQKNPLILKSGSAELKLLQHIRDEAHRFAIKYHRKLRDEMVF